jgi:2-methylcitrate dehydratase PrpD
LITSLVVGYEVAIRAGKALHATACDYHTSGAWNALGCAAIVARRLGLPEIRTRHALGTAEYHGPRSQMMRCIDHPTMLKDGSGWGAMAGVSAGLLATQGFSGAPALTVEAPEVQHIWEDLGVHWSILEQYFKPYAVCYWAQPAIAGALRLQRDHKLQADEIERIRVFTFHEASRLSVTRPSSTEEAQYSLPFPLAAALIRHRLDYAELSDRALHDSQILRLAERVELIDDDSFNARFPADRLSRVVIETHSGKTYDSGETRALWDLTEPPSDQALRQKFRELAGGVLPIARSQGLEETLWGCAELPFAATILELLTPPAGPEQEQR